MGSVFPYWKNDIIQIHAVRDITTGDVSAWRCTNLRWQGEKENMVIIATATQFLETAFLHPRRMFILSVGPSLRSGQAL
ncbi:hypothetical protein AZE99_05055 [Sphingorhabdus sp. M41]|nr:hypothetical protein AZE99_05055 [Sphingorhabdus sp. M41]